MLGPGMGARVLLLLAVVAAAAAQTACTDLSRIDDNCAARGRAVPAPPPPPPHDLQAARP
jgi:hypothetical protein